MILCSIQLGNLNLNINSHIADMCTDIRRCIWNKLIVKVTFFYSETLDLSL